jgi:hypothetical protein
LKIFLIIWPRNYLYIYTPTDTYGYRSNQDQL